MELLFSSATKRQLRPSWLGVDLSAQRSTTASQPHATSTNGLTGRRPRALILASLKTFNLMNTELTVMPGTGIDDLLVRAVDSKLPVEALERLLAMRRELKAESAREAFFRALAAFQAACPVITKDKEVMNTGGRSVRYRYAPLDSIVKQVSPILKENGFSYTLTAEVAGEWVTAICTLHHELGHKEDSQFKVPIDKDAFMAEAQKFASALTFTKRYAFCNALGILTGDEDDDAVTTATPPPKPTATPGAATPLKPVPSKGWQGDKHVQAMKEWLERQRENLVAKMEVQGRAAIEYAVKMGIILSSQEGLRDGHVGKWFPSVDWSKTIDENKQAVLSDGQNHLRALQAMMDGEQLPLPVEDPPIVISEKPDLNGCQIAQGVVEHVSVKEGTSKQGPWVRTGICMDDVWYSTFHQNLGKMASDMKDRSVTVWFRPAKLGNDLVWIDHTTLTP